METAEPPIDVQALARAENLGKLREVVRPAKRPGAFVGWLLVGLFPCAFLFGAKPIASLVVGAFLWPLMVLRGLRHSPLVSRKAARRRLYVFEHGFVYAASAEGLEAFAWRRIARQRDRVVVIAGVIRFRRYMLTRDDGESVVLTNFWVHIREVMKGVITQVANVQLADAKAAIERGESVEFGKLVVDATGVSGPRGWAPWSDIEVSLNARGRIFVRASDGFLPLFSARTEKVPNVPVFIALYRARKPASG